MLLGSVFLALQNVILRLVFIPGPIFGRGQIGGWLEPSFGNALFLLWLRTILMAIFLVTIAPRLYRPVFSDLRRLLQQQTLLAWVVLSGLLLALSLALLNLAISQVKTGIAIGVFFTHSAWTVLLAWIIWGDRPSRVRLWLMGVIVVGVMLTTFPPVGSAAPTFITGSLAAIGAAFVYSAYSLTTQLCLKPKSQYTQYQPLHPIPFSVLNFWVVVMVTSISLLSESGIGGYLSMWPLLMAGVWSAIASLLAYVLLNFGVSLVGAALTNLLSSATPILSVLFAWIGLNETLRSWQIAGVVLVAVGIAALGLSMRRNT